MNILEAVQAEIRKRLNELTDEVINNSAKDYAEYRYECGKAYGLAMSESIIQDLVRIANRVEADDFTE